MKSLRRIKSFLSGIWRPLSGIRNFGFNFGAADIYGSPDPSPADLIAAYSDVSFACVNLIANNLAALEPKLCVLTAPGEPAPRHLTLSLPHRDRERIRKEYRPARKAAHFEELPDHPLIDLLENPNPHMSGKQLIGATVVCMELCGSAFWLIREPIPAHYELYLLPPASVRIDTDERGYPVTYTQFADSDAEQVHDARDVIHFRHQSPADPIGSFGVSPLRAVWQRVLIGRQELSSWQAVLNNMAHPSAIVGPPPGEQWTEEQAERLNKQLWERFGLGRQGGMLVQTEPYTINAFNPPPKDLAAIQLYDTVKGAVCNAYAVPRPLLDMQDSNLASADTAKRYFQEHNLKPRASLILDAINRGLVARFSRRLFFDGGEIVQPDKTFLLQETSALTAANLLMINEGRKRHGYEPVPGGDRFLYQISNVGLGTPSISPTKGLTVKGWGAAEQFAGVLRSLFRRMRVEVLAKVSVELNGKAWIPIENWTQEIARQCSPFVRLAFQNGVDGVQAQLGGDPAMRLLAVPKLTEAVNGAVLQFADSTLSATNLEVDAAVAKVRAELKTGISQGEANRRITERIEAIFTDLSENRAYLIADTEGNRARHAGEMLMLNESGVRAKKVWIADNRACPICSALDGQMREPDAPFLNDGKGGPYSVVQHPPAHPACRCSQGYEVVDQSGS